MNNEMLSKLKLCSVLLVDNNDSFRKKLANLLSAHVGKMYEANNGIEGLEIFNNFNPSIIITDIEMPKMDGLTFISKIKKINSNIPIIIISGVTTEEYLLKAIKLSLVNYLEKPLIEEQLFRTLSKALAFIKITKLFGEIEIKEDCIYDATNKQFIINKKYHRLSKSEIYLFELLIMNKGLFVTKDMIKNGSMLFKNKSNFYVNHIMYKLRKKIGKDLIITSSNLGYIFV